MTQSKNQNDVKIQREKQRDWRSSYLVDVVIEGPNGELPPQRPPKVTVQDNKIYGYGTSNQPGLVNTNAKTKVWVKDSGSSPAHPFKNWDEGVQTTQIITRDMGVNPVIPTSHLT